MSKLQLHAITLENVIKLQIITITFLITPTLLQMKILNTVIPYMTIFL